MAETVDDKIDRELAMTRVPGSRNNITAADLRLWAVEHLAEYDKELARFPELIGQPHWNLWMMDTELDDALFAVLMFGPIDMRFVCGTGNSFEVRSWSGNAPTHSSGLEAELRRDFRIPQAGLSIDRVAAEAWLGRGW